MAESSAAHLQLVSDHFKSAGGDWCRIADEVRAALARPDDSLLAERPAS